MEYKIIKPIVLDDKTEAEKIAIEKRRNLCPNYENGYCVHGIGAHKCNCDCAYMSACFSK